MYCLLCHAKIPRLRAWRTKSEFCSDEHAEAYKNQMLDRLMVNESEGNEKPERAKLPASAEIAASRAKEPPTPVVRDEPEVSEPLGHRLGGGMLGLSSLSKPPSRQDDLSAEPQTGGAKGQTAEEALAALRELAENAAHRSKGKPARAEPPMAETPPGDPLGEMALSETSAPAEREDVFDELRELAGRALPVDAEGEESGAEQGVDDLDMVTRSSALERLMQEAVSSEGPAAGIEADEPLEIDELLRKHADDGAAAAPELPEEKFEELVAEEAAVEEAVSEPVEEAPQVPAEEVEEAVEVEEVVEQTVAAAEPEAEEAAEVLAAASENTSEETPTDPGEKAAAGRGNVVPFPSTGPSAGAEPAGEPLPEMPKAAKAESKPPGRAPQQDVRVARASDSRKASSHLLLRGKMALEPLLDLFSAGHEEPAVEESQAGWDEFVRQVRGGLSSLKEVNGVIETKVLPAYPPGPQPSPRVCDLAKDFALFDTLPATEDGPQLEMQPTGAEIAGFDAACVHPELVFLNFSLSTTQAKGLFDMAEWISGSVSLPVTETQIAMRPAAGQIAEPSFTTAIPSGFLLRCGDLSLSEDPGFLAGELLTMGALPTDFSGAERLLGASGTANVGEFRRLNQPSMGTEFPDRLFGGVEGASASSDRLQAGEMAGAEPTSRDLPSGSFSPIEGAGKGSEGKGGARGVFEPVFETKRPLDRDLSDYV